MVVDEERIEIAPRSISLRQVKTDIINHKKIQKYRHKCG
tara:strand:- start:352 stop:468 length:117 start_codon:yes stop_codon:yes gene_type:complete